MSIELNLFQAQQLIEMYGGDDTSITLAHIRAHSGEGIYAYYSEYPEEGCNKLFETAEEMVALGTTETKEQETR